jgi:hypothetical protein
MHRKILIAAALATTMISGTAAVASASVRPATTSTENVQIVSTSANPSSEAIIMTGNIAAAGAFVPKGDTGGKAYFPDGSIEVTTHLTGDKESYNPATCLLTVSFTSSFTISDGTGKDAGASGSGTSQGHILAIGKRLSTGKCSMSSYSGYQTVITGQGTATL